MAPKTRELSLEDKLEIRMFMIANSNNGKPRYGAVSDAVVKFGVSRRTIHRIQKEAKDPTVCDSITESFKPKTGTRGRKRTNLEKLEKSIKPVHFNRRRTYRSFGRASGIPKSTLFDLKKRGDLTKYTVHTKPVLSEKNKADRVKFALAHAGTSAPDFTFQDMNNVVHIDEKWFYIMPLSRSMLLLKGETPPPNMKAHSKRYIMKVMFIAAVAKPRWDSITNTMFDGKIGLWPIIDYIPAQRNSRNRPKGTLEMKPKSVTREVYRALILEKVIPAIKSKMPFMRSKELFIQQDNARPHVPLWDEECFEVGTADEWNIRMKNQPANSPDVNICDLGFFNTVQSIQQEKCASRIEDLVQNVQDAFEEVESTSLLDNFITIQAVFREILRSNGGNDFKIPHLKKQVHRRAGKPIVNVTCDAETILKAHEFLDKSIQ